jgi:hypothetical protein
MPGRTPAGVQTCDGGLLFTTRIATLWPNLEADGASAATSDCLSGSVMVVR